ncbi:MAG: penicillin-binding protein 1B, partial [Gammaproteobacteria bacterium]|nr:penicillin-binding protein 1B [Gammaproteobacteria bacterium]
VMQRFGLISPNQASSAKSAKLNVIKRSVSHINKYPAFMDMVRRQLHEDYDEDDLQTEGLYIFTSMDPFVQSEAETVLANELSTMERYYGIKHNTLQSAMVITNSTNGEVQAIIGGRETGYAGFNRALDARRHIGSLIKPVIYLTALEQAERFHVASILKDEAISVVLSRGKYWSPENYDKKFHGDVPAIKALTNSYNLATINLGLELGVDKVIATLRRLGVSRPVNVYPSFLLGATELSPMDVTQAYQTLANGGFSVPLRSIRAVVDSHGRPLQRYELKLSQAADPRAVYILNRAMELVVREGTGRKLYQRFPEALSIAGKTGTTNDLKDSWFAGYTGDRLAVVWMGRDDNESAGFSGSTGAMRIWGRVLEELGTRSLELIAPDEVSDYWVDINTGAVTLESCSDSVSLPFITGSIEKSVQKQCSTTLP